MASRKDIVQRRTGLRDEIIVQQGDGRLKPGDLLPPVRELALRHKVSHRVVFQELQKLAQSGVVETVPRVGTYLRNPQPAPPAPSFMSQAVGVLALNDVKPGDWHDQQTGWSAFVALGAVAEVQKSAAGYHTVVMNPDRLCDEVMQRFADDPPYGVVICELLTPQQELQWAQAFATRGLAVVACLNLPSPHYDSVVHDHEAASYELTCWMIAHGRRRIANLWPEPATQYWFAHRQHGYQRAMLEAGLEPLPAIIAPYGARPGDGASFQGSARSLGGHLIEHLTGTDKVDALLLASDGFVPETSAALRLFGLESGQDVLLGGYDAYWNEMFFREFEGAVPAVTIDKRNPDLGAAMVRLLTERKAGHLPLARQSRVLSHALVEISN